MRSEYAPWLTTNIKKSMNQRDYLKKKAIKTKSPVFHQAYKESRNMTNKTIKRAKSQYFYKTLTKTDITLKKCGSA